MLLGAMNYANSMAFALTFLLAGIGLLAMHDTHANLVNLSIAAEPVAPVFAGDALQANLAIVDAVKAVADGLGATPGQVALAWVLAQGDDVVPIPGTKRRTYLEENTAAATVRLDASTLSAIDAAVRPDQVAGPRYNERMMAYIDR